MKLRSATYTASLSAVLLAAALVPARAFAWGHTGHQIVASIAEQLLQGHDHTNAEIAEILKADGPDPGDPHFDGALEDGGPLIKIALWADKVKSNNPAGDGTGGWHFIDLDIEMQEGQLDLSQLCHSFVYLKYGPDNAKLPKSQKTEQFDNCSVFKASEFFRVLADKTASPADRVRALKFFVHIIGDMHQPLHNAHWNGDQGGNGRAVSFNEAFDPQTQKGELEPDPWYGPLNLHSVWDDAILHRRMAEAGFMVETDQPSVETLEPSKAKKPKIASYAAHLIKDVMPGKPTASWLDGGVIEWAWDAHLLAKDVAYAQPPFQRDCCQLAFGQKTIDPQLRVTLDEAYYQKSAEVVEDQLLRGGVRLAYLLDQAFN